MNMSDSENELLNGDAFIFQNDRTTYTEQGPNINSRTLSGISFTNNPSASRMQMSGLSNWLMSTESHHELENTHFRRPTSSMSVTSASDIRQRNFNNMFNARKMAAQKSYINGTTFSVRGPNIKPTTFSGTSFMNNSSASRMQMLISNRSTSTESHHEFENSHFRRPTSPVSVKSACDVMQRNFNMYTAQRMAAQRSYANSRCQSSISPRSIDSCASVSAISIATALNTTNYSKSDRKRIRDAYRNFIKQNRRKKIKKKRNIHFFLKERSPVPSGDSDDQTSDSSTSSDDKMSYRTSTKSNISVLRRSLRENDMLKDCSDNFRHSIQNIRNIPVNYNKASNVMSQYGNLNERQINPIKFPKDRFKSGFELPYKRFDKPVVCENITNSTKNHNGDDGLNMANCANASNIMNNGTNINCNLDSDSDEYELFSNNNQKQRIDIQQKQETNNHDDLRYDSDCYITLSSQRGPNQSSQCKSTLESRESLPKKNATVKVNNKNKTKDFVFAKPAFPVKKPTKDKIQQFANDKIISKSAALADSPLNSSDFTHIQKLHYGTSEEQKEKDHEDEITDTTQITKKSAGPSFIKRKLFSQTLDVLNKSTTSVAYSDSPQNSIYGAIQKEKHKARKLQQVTTQSCLSRDVQEKNNILLDLIHKIVPPEQIDFTRQTNRTELQSSDNKTKQIEDDVTSVISTSQNIDELSDTYTDEEVFNATMNQLAKENVSNNKKTTHEEINNCKILVEKLPANDNCLEKRQKSNMDKRDISKKVQECVRRFWDTDYETDTELGLPATSIVNGKFKENRCQDIPIQKEVTGCQGYSNRVQPEKRTTSTSNASTFGNNTIVQKFGSSTLSIKCQRTSKRKKPLDIEDNDDISDQFSHQRKKPNVSNSIEVGQSEVQQPTKIQNKQLPISKKQLPTIKETIDTIAVTQSKKPMNSNKKQVKSEQKESKRNCNQRNIENGETNNNKQKITVEQVQKTNNKNDTCIELKPNTLNNKKEHGHKIKINATKNHNLVENEHPITPPTKLTTESKKRNKSVKNDINTSKQMTHNMTLIIKSPKSKKRVKRTLNDSCVSVKTTTGETTNNNRPLRACRVSKNSLNKALNDSCVSVKTTTGETTNKNRPLRACRVSKNNLNNTGTSINETFTRTLRSRQIDLSYLSNDNVTSPRKSFTSEDATAMDTKNVHKNKLKQAREQRDAKSRINSNADKKHNNLSKIETSMQRNAFHLLNGSRSKRNRKPVRKFSISY